VGGTGPPVPPGNYAYDDNMITLIRHSAALACRRLRGAHTYDVLAESLNDVYTEYNLSTSNIVGCVTDNGSNFTKAFREFGIVIIQQSDEDSIDDDEAEDFASGDLTFESVDQILNGESSDAAPGIILPPHHPCSSHTFSLLAVTDISKILAENTALKRIHNSTMAKCSSLWNSAGRSLKSYEALERIAHRTLVRPCPTRWNSLYDALKVLQSLRPQLKAICEAVGVPAFKDMELNFIDEYVEILAPISVALDKLQGQSNESMAFMGILMPTVFSVKQRLEHIVQSSSIRHCAALANGLLCSLTRRFGKFLNFEPSANECVLASVSHPFFKLRWVPADQVDHCRLLFCRTRIAVDSADARRATSSTAPDASTSAPSAPTDHEHDELQDDFFTFITAPSSTTADDTESKIQVIIHSKSKAYVGLVCTASVIDNIIHYSNSTETVNKIILVEIRLLCRGVEPRDHNKKLS
jgi:hypothetical protein